MSALNILYQPLRPSHLAINSRFLNININNNTSFVTSNSKTPLCSNSFHSSKSSYPFLESPQMPFHCSNSGSGFPVIQHKPNIPESISIQCWKGPLCSALSTKAAAIVGSEQELFEFICSGPLIRRLGLTQEKVAESIDKWIAYGAHLYTLFQLDQLYLTLPQKVRFYHYYIPVFMWCEDQISHHSSQFKQGEDVPPLMIGFSAPQGCGKTTLVSALDYLFQMTGRKSATISIDDFYLTAEGQAKVREENSGNALLEFRGNAGTHDLALSAETLEALSKLTRKGMKMKIPRYDKSAYNGRGDRADPSTWPEVEGPLSVVLFEGWMLGFKPLPVDIVKAIDPQLEIVNKNLESYYDAWDKFIKSWMVIKVHPSCAYEWRFQADVESREAGNPGMSNEDIRDFLSRYLPADSAYLPTLYSEGPNGSDTRHVLVVELDEGRNPK